ncbi:hypothetical protein U5A82_14105 [Sphingobium sp. CR2-8]|uniref:hypothetical protein n=1 Tax=Sphingobium sp. CR2-8 TaxID=1306534 RepID=UPI002DBC6057|nr:hypothetical protein [Sphingobium sp. CR2-8]MEC3911556.1 hypothetical protein [Sphingobium sp. CR2-8]
MTDLAILHEHPPWFAPLFDAPDRRGMAYARLETGYANFDQWLSGTQLERDLPLQAYAVSNRGLNPNLIGTPEQIRERIAEYEAAGLDLLLLRMSPQEEGMERFTIQAMGTA